ncbi:MAG: 4-(cytidine 5'-diphospho)-2-C-methyl-D-erythritol kinase [Pseudomonadota bacterium]
MPTIFAPIKINLALHVGLVQPNGYHPVETLCVFPAIGDILSYDQDAPPGLDLSGPFAGELAQEDMHNNLVWRAFSLLDQEPSGRFLLVKNVPLASGVGAGTADGAAAMLLLNDASDAPLTAAQLVKRSLGLGADGPVCMAGQIAGGGLWRASGIGERLEPWGNVEPQAIVVANPGLAVSTARVFRHFDAARPRALRSLERRLGKNSLQDILHETRNDLAGPATALAPVISDLLDILEQQPGAQAARMSGSGATCYALHTSLASAERAVRQLRTRHCWADAAPLLPGSPGGF